MRPWREVNQKPPLGAQIDWAHWRAKTSVARWVMNEGAGLPRDLIAGAFWAATPATRMAWTAGALRLGGAPTVVSLGRTINLVGDYTLITWLEDWAGLVNGSWFLDDAADRAKCGIRDATGTFGMRPYSDAGYATLAAAVPVGRVMVAAQYSGTVTRLSVNGGPFTQIGSGYTANQSNAFDRGSIGGTGYLSFAFEELHAAALTADQIAEIYAEPYAGLLVPGGVTIFDMGGGGVPIGAIRTRFPTLTGGLRV